MSHSLPFCLMVLNTSCVRLITIGTDALGSPAIKLSITGKSTGSRLGIFLAVSIVVFALTCPFFFVKPAL